MSEVIGEYCKGFILKKYFTSRVFGDQIFYFQGCPEYMKKRREK